MAFDDKGIPLVGGKIYTYIAGTTTAKATYSDKGLAVANTNPVVLDRRGEAVIYGAGSYKFVFKDTDLNTIWTMDNIELSAESYCFYPDSSEADHAATSTGGSIKDILTALGTSKKAEIVLLHNGVANTTTYTIKQNADWSAYTNVTFKIVPGAVISHGTYTITFPNISESGRWQIYSGTGAITFAQIDNPVMPEWWGAKADGVTDSTYALNAAAIASQSGSLAGGTYLTDGWVVNGAGNHWFGVSGHENVGVSSLIGTKIKARGTQAYVLSTIGRYSVFEHIIFDGSWTTTTVVTINVPSLFIKFKHCTFMATLDDTGLNGESNGKLVHDNSGSPSIQGDNMLWEDCLFVSGDGAKISAEGLCISGSNAFLNNVNRCYFDCARIHINIDAGGARISRNEFEHFEFAAIYYIGSSQSLLVESNYSESSTGMLLRMSAQSALVGTQIVLRDNHSTPGLLLYLGQPITLENNMISGAVQLEPPGDLTPYWPVLSIRNSLSTGFTGSNSTRIIELADAQPVVPFALETTTDANVGTFDLTINSATTVVTSSIIRAGSLVYLTARTANAAADVGSATGVYVSAISAGESFTVTHPNSATAGRTFQYLIVN